MLTILTVDGTCAPQTVPFRLHYAAAVDDTKQAIRASMLDMIQRWGPGLYAQQKRIAPTDWIDDVDGLTVWGPRRGVYHICPWVVWIPDDKWEAVMVAWSKPLQVCHSWATLVDTVKEPVWVE